MSVAEMKLAAIQEITKLDDEHSLKEILEHLAKLSVTQDERAYQLSQHFGAVVNKYGNVLKKLAQ
jgi:transposase